MECGTFWGCKKPFTLYLNGVDCLSTGFFSINSKSTWEAFSPSFRAKIKENLFEVSPARWMYDHPFQCPLFRGKKQTLVARFQSKLFEVSPSRFDLARLSHFTNLDFLEIFEDFLFLPKSCQKIGGQKGRGVFRCYNLIRFYGHIFPPNKAPLWRLKMIFPTAELFLVSWTQTKKQPFFVGPIL